jgi:hypothetical protein
LPRDDTATKRSELAGTDFYKTARGHQSLQHSHRQLQPVSFTLTGVRRYIRLVDRALQHSHTDFTATHSHLKYVIINFFCCQTNVGVAIDAMHTTTLPVPKDHVTTRPKCCGVTKTAKTKTDAAGNTVTYYECPKCGH